HMQGRGQFDGLGRIAQDADLDPGRQVPADVSRRLVDGVIEALRPAAGQNEAVVDGLLHVSLQEYGSRVCLRSPPSRTVRTGRYWRVQEFSPRQTARRPRIWHRLRTYSAEWERRQAADACRAVLSAEG